MCCTVIFPYALCLKCIFRSCSSQFKVNLQLLCWMCELRTMFLWLHPLIIWRVPHVRLKHCDPFGWMHLLFVLFICFQRIPSFSPRLHGADDPHPPSSPHGRHGRPPVSHQHLQALNVAHVQLGLFNERAGVPLPRHHVFPGLPFHIVAVHAQHELWTTRQPAGEKMCGCCDALQMGFVLKGVFLRISLNFSLEENILFFLHY